MCAGGIAHLQYQIRNMPMNTFRLKRRRVVVFRPLRVTLIVSALGICWSSANTPMSHAQCTKALDSQVLGKGTRCAH